MLTLTGSLSMGGSFQVPAAPGGDTGVFMGGFVGAARFNNIEYITISSTGNTADFGDLTEAKKSADHVVANGLAGDRGVVAGGGLVVGRTTVVEYINISTPGNATDFGDHSEGIDDWASVDNGSNDRGIFTGGSNGSVVRLDADYITISTNSNTTSFGSLSQVSQNQSGCSNGVNERGVIIGAWNTVASGTYYNIMEYFTISTPSGATDFGDLLGTTAILSASSNTLNERGVIFAGFNGAANINTIQYITISTTGNAADFGDLSVKVRGIASCANGMDDRAVAGTGIDDVSAYINVLEYVTVSSLGNATDFGDYSFGVRSPGGTSNAD